MNRPNASRVDAQDLAVFTVEQKVLSRDITFVLR